MVTLSKLSPGISKVQLYFRLKMHTLEKFLAQAQAVKQLNKDAELDCVRDFAVFFQLSLWGSGEVVGTVARTGCDRIWLEAVGATRRL